MEIFFKNNVWLLHHAITVTGWPDILTKSYIHVSKVKALNPFLNKWFSYETFLNVPGEKGKTFIDIKLNLNNACI